MINLKLFLINPWSSRWELTASQHCMLIGSWAWESSTYKTNQILALEFEVNLRTDHQGIRLFIALLGHGIEFNLYDREHLIDKKRRRK